MVDTKWISKLSYDRWCKGDICTIIYHSKDDYYACVFDKDIGGHSLGNFGAPSCEDGHGWWIPAGGFYDLFEPIERPCSADIKYSFDSFFDGALRG